MHWGTFDDHFPIISELGFPNGTFAESIHEITEVRYNIVSDEVSDDTFESHDYIFDTYSMELRPDFLSCNISSFDNTLHHQRMGHLCSALVQCLN